MSQSKRDCPSYSQRGTYSLDEVEDFLHDALDNAEIVKNQKNESYYNVPAAFDIETTSFYQDGDKCATMYIWMLGINGCVITGRTWEAFFTVYDAIILYGVSLKTRLAVYVHNLDFEFGFICRRFQWEKVFAIDSRKPIYALTDAGVEFRCSYKLSGTSLEIVGKNLQKYKCEKKVGQLDYTLKRHSRTPLSPEEFDYCIYDIYVLMAYIAEKIETDGDITKIPLTNTGYVRRFCRRACLYAGNPNAKKNPHTFFEYRKLMSRLTLTPELYTLAKEAFAGGFVHANAFYVGKVLSDVASLDLTSAYPTQMCCQLFPMSPGVKVDISSEAELARLAGLYCILMKVRIYGLESYILQEHYLSESKCSRSEGLIAENGRILYADMVETAITEQDFFIMKKAYTWEKIEVITAYRFQRGYLPKNLILAILELYGKKTKLKGVDGEETEYMLGKGMLNSAFGMMVTDIVRALYRFEDGKWMEPEEPDTAKQLELYNNSKNRFSYYLWGVWITAYCRRQIWLAILECGSDYAYSDTDSSKLLHYLKHKDFFDTYNRAITRKLECMCEHYGIDLSLLSPVDIKGIAHPLGVYEYEGAYEKFKTLGAKRYLVETGGTLKLTAAGLSKKIAGEYISRQKDPFGFFSDDMYIPSEYTGKLTHTYIEEEDGGFLTDYTGVTAPWHELSSVHLEPAEYSLSLTDDFIDYLKGIQDDEKTTIL